MTDTQDSDATAVPSMPVRHPRRSQQALLKAAAEVFVESGVDAPVREVAAKAGVGTGTVHRRFPTLPQLVVAVYRYQVETCAEAGPRRFAESATAEGALRTWVALFVDFLVTKRGLATALQCDDAGQMPALLLRGPPRAGPRVAPRCGPFRNWHVESAIGPGRLQPLERRREPLYRRRDRP